jgi:ribosomal peptide maturation radical SAM protein 1
MYRIALVNMPFAAVNTPSIGLTQLRSVVHKRLRDRVSVDILYINQDFARHFNRHLYQAVTEMGEHHNSGLGDWFFRQAAFPNLPDNTQEYLQRYYPQRSQQALTYRTIIQEKRKRVPDFLSNVISRYELDNADLVGFTSMFAQNVSSFALARMIKERNPGVITVMGGANCETPMGQEIVKNVNKIDFVFSGPGLKSFPEFVGHCLAEDVEKCHSIPGVFSKANLARPTPEMTPGSPATASPYPVESVQIAAIGSALAAAVPRAEMIGIGEELDIDNIIELDYEPFLQTLEKNFPDGEVKPRLFFETSRGCWWGQKAHCTFCGLNGSTMSYRAMSPEKALQQFGSILAYSDRCDDFSCVDNIMPKTYLTDVFPFLEVPPNVTIFYEVKADLSEEEMKILQRARVRDIQPGIESLATSTLKLMKKGANAFQNLTFLKNCLMYDITPEWNLLIGFPGEGADVYKTYVDDIPKLIHLYPPSGAYPVRFDRYSPYFVQAKHYGLDLHPVDYYRLVYPFDEAVLNSLAYYFKDENLAAPYFTTMVEWIDDIKRQIEQWRARWQSESKQKHPALFFKETERSVVYDTRSGEAVEHRVSDPGLEMLRIFNKPKRMSDLYAEMSHISPAAIEDEIVSLSERGLVFHENGRFMNLVLPKDLRR